MWTALADLVIEIVSADSVGRDRGEKYYEYEQAGIPEYWLIDSRTRRAEFYQLQGAYYQPMFPDAQGIYRSRVLPGFWLNVGWLQQELLPDVEDVLLDVGGQDYAARQIERLRRRGYLPTRGWTTPHRLRNVHGQDQAAGHHCLEHRLGGPG